MTDQLVVDHATEQARAEAELAGGDDWPDRDTRCYMRRRKQWLPIDVLPDIATYQPRRAA